MKKILLTNTETKESEIFSDFKELFQKFGTSGLFVETVEDGNIIVNSEKDKNKKIAFEFGYVEISETKKDFEKEISEYRNMLRDNFKSLQKQGIPMSKDQTDNLAKQFVFLGK